MEKKNVVFLTVLAVATLLTAVVGTTFAYFSTTVSYVNNVAPQQTNVTSATLDVSYSDGAAVAVTDILPGWSATKTISVTNNSSVPVQYNIDWTSVTNTFVAETDLNFKYSATVTGTNAPSAITATAMPTSNGAFIENVYIPVGATHTYTITFAYDNKDYSQDVNQGKVFAGTFAVTVNNISNGSVVAP